MSDPNSRHDEEQRLDDIIAAYLERVESGQETSEAEWICRFPEFRDELTEFFRRRARLERMASPLRTIAQPGGAVSTQRLGDFQILREIGRGGMGVVYEAEQLSLGRRVALKILPRAAMLDERQVRRFQNEAQAAALLEHPHIVNVFFVGQERGIHFFTMRLIDGQSLATLIQQLREEPRRGDQPAQREARRSWLWRRTSQTSDPSHFRTIAQLGRQAAEALEYAHQQGVVHRDVKPSNLLVDRAGKLWVTDFGLAATQLDSHLTMTGDLLGTARYMSPEQASGRRDVLDHRTDVYSLGATLYELLTLQPAFDGDDQQQILRSIEQHDPTPPRSVNRAIPRDLETIVLKAMAKSATDRYQSVGAMADDLLRFLENKPILARRSGPLTRLRRWARRNPALAALAALMVIVSTVAPLIALRQHRLAEELRMNNYLLSLSAAYQAWDQGLFDQIGAPLAAQIPNFGQRDLRGFEWHHLWGRWQRLQVASGLMHPAPVTAIAFSPSSHQLAIGCMDGSLSIWDRREQKLLKRIPAHTGIVRRVAYSSDGRWIASGGSDHLVNLWSSETFSAVASLTQHDGTIEGLCFVPDRPWLITSSGDARVMIWDVADPSPPRNLQSFVAHNSPLNGLTVSPDGKQLATYSWDQTVRVWSLPEGELVTTITEPSVIHSVKFSPNGELLAAAGLGYVSLRDARTWQRIGRLSSGRDPVGDTQFAPVAFSADSRFLVVPLAGSYAVWDVESQSLVDRLDEHWQRGPVSLSPDGQWIATVAGASVRLQPFSSSEAPRLWENDLITEVCFVETSQEQWVVVGHGESYPPDGRGSLSVLDARDFRHLYTIDDLPAVISIASCPSSPHRVAVSGGPEVDTNWPGEVRLIDLRTGQQVKQLVGTPGQVWGLAFSPDGNCLAVSHNALSRNFEDRTTDMWDWRTERRVWTVPGSGRLAFSPDGSQIAVVGRGRQGGSVRCFNADTGKLMFAADEEPGLVADVVFTPDGRQIVTAGYSGHLKVWDAATGTLLRTAQTLGTKLVGLSCSPDGLTVAAGGDRGEVKLWNIQSGHELATFTADSPVTSVCFTPHGDRLIAASRDGKLTVWFRDGRRQEVLSESGILRSRASPSAPSVAIPARPRDEGSGTTE